MALTSLDPNHLQLPNGGLALYQAIELLADLMSAETQSELLLGS